MFESALKQLGKIKDLWAVTPDTSPPVNLGMFDELYAAVESGGEVLLRYVEACPDARHYIEFRDLEKCGYAAKHQEIYEVPERYNWTG